LKLSFADRFRRQCKAAFSQDKAAILKILLDLELSLTSPQEHTGLGLRKLHPAGYWEVRAGLSLRAIFRLDKDEAIFVFLGNHDEVKRFLSSL
jgi:mRNA-degrading endonuclease YafQ of YafQ-DinJ toxin-antitoxin module